MSFLGIGLPESRSFCARASDGIRSLTPSSTLVRSRFSAAFAAFRDPVRVMRTA